MSESLWRLLRVIGRQSTAFCHASSQTIWHRAVQYAMEQTFKQSLHHLVYLSHPQLHYCCFTRTSHCVRALKTKQMELVGNRRHANHGSFDWRSYLIIQPSGHLGEDSVHAAYCTICVSNCYNIQLIMSETKDENQDTVLIKASLKYTWSRQFVRRKLQSTQSVYDFFMDALHYMQHIIAHKVLLQWTTFTIMEWDQWFSVK